MVDDLPLARQAYLYPVEPSSDINSFEHRDVLDGSPSRGKRAVSRDLCLLVKVKKYYVHDRSIQIGPLLLWPKRERPHPPRLSTAHGGKSVGSMGWCGRSYAPPLLARRGLGVQETSIEIPIRAV